jgi:hypothetical protein
LKKLHRDKPTIDEREYSDKSIPRKAETLVARKKGENNYVIRDLTKYDFVKDDFPDEQDDVNNTVIIDEDEESDSAESDTSSSEEEDNGESAQLFVISDTTIDNAGDDGDTESDNGKRNEYLACCVPNDEEWKDDGEKIGVEIKKAKGEWKGDQKMVYFGLENILTGKNSAGNIHKASYFNYLRAIAMLDRKSLTDEMVDRLFPRNKQVRHIALKS